MKKKKNQGGSWRSDKDVRVQSGVSGSIYHPMTFCKKRTTAPAFRGFKTVSHITHTTNIYYVSVNMIQVCHMLGLSLSLSLSFFKSYRIKNTRLVPLCRNGKIWCETRSDASSQGEKRLLHYKLIHDNLCNKEVSFGVQTRSADRKSANLKLDARGRKDSGTSLQSFHRSYSSQGWGPRLIRPQHCT